MTPPSIHRIQSDDELLDRIGSRATARDGVPDDDLTDLLAGWVAHVDDAPAAASDKTPGRYARTRRGGVRAGVAAAVLVGTLSVSGMAAAVTSTTVPVLQQLGQVTRGLVFVPPDAATQHQTPSPGAPIADGTATTFLTAPPPPGTPQDRYTSSASALSPSSIFRRPAPGSTSSRRPTSSRTAPTSTPPLTSKPTTTAPTTPPRTTAPTTAPTFTVTPTTPPTSTGSPTGTSGPTRTVRPTMPTSPGASSSTTTVPTSPTPRLSTSTSSSPPAPSSTPAGSAG
ncbi:hypothetical protein [Allobranchiibius sp. GilTou38]|uniref:hypothetical protein n=1 Tax=Allobranchiibius sp. GilTou38 TaxID=2815210 RepID=UPI001AA0E1E8|nr:hypothetical protein [Allobranchiibius sp. GilTou38]MBO1768480.1 hypothetical protein [Allobranchiibius sp. GilTou38]